jgi:hypothetical protein
LSLRSTRVRRSCDPLSRCVRRQAADQRPGSSPGCGKRASYSRRKARYRRRKCQLRSKRWRDVLVRPDRVISSRHRASATWWAQAQAQAALVLTPRGWSPACTCDSRARAAALQDVARCGGSSPAGRDAVSAAACG